jgi:hypothetical protein
MKVKLTTNIMYFIFCLLTGIIGYNVNVRLGSSIPLFWACMDFLFSPIAWSKWLICQDINITIIKESFSFFFQ